MKYLFVNKIGLGLASLIVASVGFIVVPVPQVEAVGCYGDYCSGKDPVAMGCDADGQTLAWKDLSGARLELRWSPTCKTEWARWQQYPLGLKSDILIQLAAIQIGRAHV